MENDLIRRGDALSAQNKSMNLNEMRERLNRIPAVDAVEVDTVCEMMEFLFDDSCPCNYNGIDEWLPYVCEDQEECPNPAIKYGCWKQFITHFGKRREDGDNGKHL